jgi:hypothetical protein
MRTELIFEFRFEACDELSREILCYSTRCHLPHVLIPFVVLRQLEKYQEQPELLDPHLENIVSVLMGYLRIQTRLFHASNQNVATAPAKSFTPGPRSSSIDHAFIQVVFKMLYTLCKVRGYKTVTRFFPHEVSDLEQTLALLVWQNPQNHATWETRHGLLLWLSMIVLIPFDLTTVDSTIFSPNHHEQPKQAESKLASGAERFLNTELSRGGIVAQLVRLCCVYLGNYA